LFFHSSDTSSVIQTNYSSVLTSDSQTYARISCELEKYYYEAIQVKVFTAGTYTFGSISSIDTYGYLYESDFNPFNPTVNLQAQNDNGCGNLQLQIITELQMNRTCILIVSTSSPNATGLFSIFVSGPNNVTLNRISEYLYYVRNK